MIEGAMNKILELSEAQITQRLGVAIANNPPPEHEELHRYFPGELRPAAVLIPFLKKDNDWHVLFTRRNDGLAEHSGQVAFPGGRADPLDASPEQTALREAQEEIGVNPADVQILGRLRQSITITHYLVTPVVGVIPWPYALRLEPNEVSRVFTIPLDWLADPANRIERWRDLPAPLNRVSVIYYNTYDGEVLWGASARFTLNLLETLK